MQWLRIAGLVLLALAWLPPGHYPPWPSFQGEFLASLGLLALALSQAANRTDTRGRWPAMALLGFCLTLLPVLQWCVGQIRFLTDLVLAVAYLGGFSLAILVGWHGRSAAGAGQSGSGTHLPRPMADLSSGLFISLLVAAALSVALALGQWVGWQGMWIADLRPGARPYANLGQANQLATLLGWGLMAVIHLHEHRRLGGLAAGMLAGWLALGLAMTQSRTAWVFSAGLLLCFVVWRQRAGLKTSSRAAVVMAGGLAFLVLAWPKLNQQLLITEMSAWQERLQAGVRAGLWEGLWPAILQSPWLGWGWNQGVVAQYASAAQGHGGGRMLDYAHNLVLDLALWGGLPLAGVITLLLVAWVRRQVRHCRSSDAWCLLGSLGILAVHCLTEYPHAYLYFLLPAGLFIGALEAGCPSGPGVAVPRWLKTSLTWAGLLLASSVAVAYLGVEEDERTVRFALARIGSAPPLDPAPSRLMDLPVAYQHFRLAPARAGLTPKDLATMRDVVERRPFPPALLRYALAAGLNGRPDEARRALIALCHMHPQPRCEEARASWRVAQARHPELLSIAPP